MFRASCERSESDSVAPRRCGVATVTTPINTVTGTKRYSLAQLYSLKNGNGYPEGSVCEKLKALNLFHARSRKKTRPAINNIETIISTKRRNRQPPLTRPPNVKEVPRVWFDLPTLLLSNVTSLANKIDELTVTTKSSGPDIVAVTEEWQITPEISTITGYTLFHHLRKNKRGGGVALFCRENLSPSQLHFNFPQGIEVRGSESLQETRRARHPP